MEGSCEFVLRRQSGEFVFGGEPCHCHCPFRQDRKSVGGEIGGGNEGNLLADKNPQAQIFRFGTLDILQFSQPVGHTHRDVLEFDRIGSIRARLQRSLYEAIKTFSGGSIGKFHIAGLCMFFQSNRHILTSARTSRFHESAPNATFR